MKFLVLITILIVIFVIFRFLSKNRVKKTNGHKNTTIDLEIDPKTKEYKPKE